MMPGQASRTVMARSTRSGARAVHLGRFLHRWVHGAEDRGGHDEGERREVEPLHPAHAEDGRDRERRGHAEHDLEQLIEQPDARMQQEQPSHGDREARDQQPDRHQREQQRLGAEVGAFGDPGDRDADAERDRERHERERERVDQHRIGAGVGEHFGVVGGRVGEAGAGRAVAPAQPQHHDEMAEDDEARADDGDEHRRRQEIAERAARRCWFGDGGHQAVETTASWSES